MFSYDETVSNPLPGIETYNENMNPVVISPNATYGIPFYQTKDTLIDVDVYRSFLKNCEYRFRNSATYTNYKAYLMENGMNRCQIHGYINGDMKGVHIEMHHAILTLLDISLMISEHLLNTVGYVTTFDVVQALKEEHKNNNVAIVMLSKTPHQVYHDNTSEFYIHPSMCFGNWPNLIEKYKMGLTQELSVKLLNYISRAAIESGTNDNGLLDLREKIKEWSAYCA